MTEMVNDFDGIKERWNKATPGPWIDSNGDPAFPNALDRDEDQIFVAWAYHDMGQLLERIKGLEQQVRFLCRSNLF